MDPGTDLARFHDLEGAPVLEHAVLVDAGVVRERVGADHGLVGLHEHAGELRDQARGAIQLRVVELRGDAVHLRVQAGGHGHLLERRVAGALADAVDAGLDLARAAEHADQRVGGGETEVVVAVHGEHDVAQRRHLLVHPRDQAAPLVGRCVADGVGQVDRGRAGFDAAVDDLGEVLALGAARIHRRELDVLAERLRQRGHRDRAVVDLALGHAQLALAMDRRGADEDVDARACGRLERRGAGAHVGLEAAREPGDHRTVDLLGDRLHRGEVARGAVRETRLR